MVRRASAIVPLLLTLFCVVPTAATAGPAGLAAAAVWAGRFDVLENDGTDEIGGELRFIPVSAGEVPVPWTISPAIGAMRTSDHATFVHVGFRLDLPVTDRFTLTPQLGAGRYRPGNGKILGGHFHFRSGIEASFRLGARTCIGLLFYHLSNSGIRHHNPGEESLVVQWAVSF